MQFISHRINSALKLPEINPACGAEIDIRYHEDELILHHDPFGHHHHPIETLEHFLSHFQLKGPLILNIKTEGIEEKCIQLMNRYGLTNWFFLDLSPPYFVKYSLIAESGKIPGFGKDNLAVRFSEYEPLEFALSFSGRVGWVWVDCFKRMPLDSTSHQKLSKAGFKICLVSPELHGHSLERIQEFKKQVAGLKIDAVCTKRPDLW